MSDEVDAPVTFYDLRNGNMRDALEVAWSTSYSPVCVQQAAETLASEVKRLRRVIKELKRGQSS